MNYGTTNFKYKSSLGYKTNNKNKILNNLVKINFLNFICNIFNFFFFNPMAFYRYTVA